MFETTNQNHIVSFLELGGAVVTCCNHDKNIGYPRLGNWITTIQPHGFGCKKRLTQTADGFWRLVCFLSAAIHFGYMYTKIHIDQNPGKYPSKLVYQNSSYSWMFILQIWAIHSNPEMDRTVKSNSDQLRFYLVGGYNKTSGLFWINDHNLSWIVWWFYVK